MLYASPSFHPSSAARPYSQHLLGISPAMNAAVEQALLDKNEVLRPGYTRLSLPYWLSAKEVDYILAAVEFVASSGACFLPQYRYNYKVHTVYHMFIHAL